MVIEQAGSSDPTGEDVISDLHEGLLLNAVTEQVDGVRSLCHEYAVMVDVDALGYISILVPVMNEFKLLSSAFFNNLFLPISYTLR